MRRTCADRVHRGRGPWRPPVLAILLLTLLAGCADGEADGDADQAIVRDSAGVAVVENQGPDRPLAATPVKLADLTTPDGALTPVPWGVAAAPSGDRLYVLDRTGQRIAVFSGSGEFVEWLGRAGGGPGEFRSPTALAVDRHGALHVLDSGRGIVSRWSSEGDLLNEERAPEAFWGPGLEAAGDGWLYVASSRAEGGLRQTLVREGRGDTTALHSVLQEREMMELPCIRQAAPRVFAPSVLWAAASDRVYVLNGTDYRVDVRTDSGLVGSWRRPLDPVAVTPAMAERRVEIGPYRGFMRMCGVDAATIVEAVGHEPEMPPVLWLAAGPGGRLWVTRTQNGLAPSRVDLLSSEGRYLGSFPAPGLVSKVISDSAFVALEVSESGETALSLHVLRTGGDSPADPG